MAKKPEPQSQQWTLTVWPNAVTGVVLPVPQPKKPGKP